MKRFYLGVPVEADDFDPIFGGDCWVWATWPDGRRFKHWGDQLKQTPFNTPQPVGQQEGEHRG